MDINNLLHLSRDNKELLWDTFKYEQILEDTEDDLLKDLEYYNKKLKLLGTADSTMDVSITTVYKAHINSINRLLDVINNIKTKGPGENRQMNIFQS